MRRNPWRSPKKRARMLRGIRRYWRKWRRQQEFRAVTRNELQQWTFEVNREWLIDNLMQARTATTQRAPTGQRK